MTAENAAGAQGAFEVGFEDSIPLGFGKIERRHFLGAAGAIDQDLDTAEFRAGGLQQALDAGVVRDIANLGERAAAQGHNFRSGFAHQFLAAAGGHDVRAGLSQAPGKGKPNAAGSTDHDGCFAVQVKKRVAHKFSRIPSIFLQPRFCGHRF